PGPRASSRAEELARGSKSKVGPRSKVKVQGSGSIRHPLVVQAQHVADLVDDGVADLNDRLAAGDARAQDGAAADRDLRRPVGDGALALEVRCAPEDSEELVLLGDIALVVVFLQRLL